MQIWPGSPYPLGAGFDGGGTNFSIFSEVADRVELCLLDDSGRETRMDLPERHGLIWHGYLARQFHDVDRLSAFFELVNQDPVVSR